MQIIETSNHNEFCNSLRQEEAEPSKHKLKIKQHVDIKKDKLEHSKQQVNINKQRWGLESIEEKKLNSHII